MCVFLCLSVFKHLLVVIFVHVKIYIVKVCSTKTTDLGNLTIKTNEERTCNVIPSWDCMRHSAPDGKRRARKHFSSLHTPLKITAPPSECCLLIPAQHSVRSPPWNWTEKSNTLGWRSTLCKWKVSRHIRLAVVPPPYCWTLQSPRPPSCSYSKPKTGQKKPHSLCKIKVVRVHTGRK